jgi:isocitrate dehydrogenase (NAD+)
MAQRVVFIQGGGVGLDQEAAVRRVLDAAGARLEFQRFAAGAEALARGEAPLPEPMLRAVREAGVALKTKLLAPPSGEFPNFNVELRRALGLFASVRPLRSLRGLPSRFEGIDILLVREITEDLYAAIEHEVVPGVVESLKVVTEPACLRFFRFTFELARRQSRRTVHCIHKANILKLADGLFLDCFRRVAREFPDITPKELIVDNACMQLVSRPRQFEVIAAGNLYGDLLSDLGAGLIGGITNAEGINHGDGVRVYESIHGGTREQVGGPDRANPLPLLMPALELLTDLGQGEPARRIRAAVERVLVEGTVRTPDLGGTAGTQEMTEAIVGALGERSA